MTDLSILIPSRNEMFLSHTIDDILSNIEMDTEIIAVLDGQWADPSIQDNERITIIYYPQSIGQRAATNRAASIASGKYVMKVDAHCAFDKGFDRILLEDMQDDWTCAPIMRNLHAFDWICPNGHRRYQGPSGVCTQCGEPTTMDVVWIGKRSPQSTSYCFDRTLHFYYFGEFKRRPEGQAPLSESMSLQGSCFMISKKRYFDLNICDETWGSWGNQGTEVACKTWLSGGKVIINHKTWYAHMFRTQGGDFSFPYHLGGKEIENARQQSRDMFLENTWDKQIYPLSWLVEKFWPIPDLPKRPGWTDSDLATIKEKAKVFKSKQDTKIKSHWETPIIHTLSSKGIVYYTENKLDSKVMLACQNQLTKSMNGYPLISISLQPIEFGQNKVLSFERGYLTMFKQILTGLENLDTEYVFLCEHDVLYHPSHFNFTPIRDDIYYYNENTWKVDINTGHAIFYYTKQTSGLCANRLLLLEHYKKRVEKTEKMFNKLGGDTHEFRNFIRRQGFEPGSHGRSERVDDFKSESWMSEYPNIDIRHDRNLTPSRWRQDQFRDQRNCRGWKESDTVPGWDYQEGKFVEFLKQL